MRVVPLAAESLGVRSMATFVEAAGTSILVDPGASLAAARFGLPPADAEWEALRRANDRISAYAARAEFVFVSHYHDDHYRSDPASYTGRTVVARDPKRLGGAQGRRGQALWRALAGQARVTAAEGWTLRERALELRASPPLPHGPDGTTLGTVVALTVVDVAERERFVFASDVLGPLSPVATAWIIQERPTLLYLSGPPTYLERALGASAIERAVDNLVRIVETTGCRAIVDHHALRDARGVARLERVWETGRVVTAAGYVGAEETPLESQRAQLWRAVRKPPTRVAGGERAMMTREPRRLARGGSTK
ncbi:MAG: MBL fold metallo-hydrolase [Candidatus Rokuibacteriota bacterium]